MSHPERPTHQTLEERISLISQKGVKLLLPDEPNTQETITYLPEEILLLAKEYLTHQHGPTAYITTQVLHTQGIREARFKVTQESGSPSIEFTDLITEPSRRINCPRCGSLTALCLYYGDIGAADYYDLYSLLCQSCGFTDKQTLHGGTPNWSESFTKCPWCGISSETHPQA